MYKSEGCLFWDVTTCRLVDTGQYMALHHKECGIFSRCPKKLKSREPTTTALHTSYSTTCRIFTFKLCVYPLLPVSRLQVFNTMITYEYLWWSTLCILLKTI